MSTPEQAFGAMVEAVIGQAFAAAGYRAVPDTLQQAAGLFRYEKRAGRLRLAIHFQVLVYAEYPSRFQVSLRRTGEGDLPPASVTLARLLWDDFGVQVLSSTDHWWPFDSQQALGEALLEAGKLLFGYGVPWLEGTLLTGRESG